MNTKHENLTFETPKWIIGDNPTIPNVIYTQR